jgi:HPt (histidine-containing phosphotransfer) domain-containing protein
LEGAAVDPAVLAELRKLGEPAFLAELIDAFFRQTSELLALSKKGLEARNEKEVERAAHTLKGSAGSLGATQMLELCRRLEDCARRRAWPGAEGLVSELEAEYARVRVALEAERGR